MEEPTIWMVTLRWGLGLILPVFFITLSVILFKQKVWHKSGLVVKSYIKLLAAMTFVDFLLQIPSITLDIFYISSSENWSIVINNMSLSGELFTQVSMKTVVEFYSVLGEIQ